MSWLRQNWPGIAVVVCFMALIGAGIGFTSMNNVDHFPDPEGKTNGSLVKDTGLIIDTHAAKDDLEAWRKRAHQIVEEAASSLRR